MYCVFKDWLQLVAFFDKFALLDMWTAACPQAQGMADTVTSEDNTAIEQAITAELERGVVKCNIEVVMDALSEAIQVSKECIATRIDSLWATTEDWDAISEETGKMSLLEQHTADKVQTDIAKCKGTAQKIELLTQITTELLPALHESKLGEVLNLLSELQNLEPPQSSPAKKPRV